MPTSRSQISDYLSRLSERLSADEAEERLSPQKGPLAARPIRATPRATEETVEAAWATLLAHTDVTEDDRALMADAHFGEALDAYGSQIESPIGTMRMPVGAAGPLVVNGLHASGPYFVPLATTEGALVASFARGARAITAAGGAAAALLSESVIRAPMFAFPSLYQAGMFCLWVSEQFDMLKEAAEATTRHGRLIDISPEMEGDHVYLVCRYTTGDASGQNMVTIATEALCQAILAECPHEPLYWFVEGNLSGDKKASALAFMTGRGRRATAAVTLSADILQRMLRTDAERMHAYWRASALGGVMSGTIGVHGHFANGLAALYIATGQDAACVAESSVGVTRMEIRGTELYVSVTLPNLMLGTVGGGTHLPTQSAGLRMLRLEGAGQAPAFAEVTAALCLAGEISIIAALSAGDFARAHKTLGRSRR